MPPQNRAKAGKGAGKTGKGALGGALKNSSKTTRTQDLDAVKGGAFRHKDKHAHLDESNYKSYQNTGVSITEQNDLQEFLNEAELSNRNFETERARTRQLLFEAMNKDSESEDDYEQPENLEEILALNNEHILTEAELQEIRETILRLPRRPEWTKETTRDELHHMENTSFLEWRRALAVVEEDHDIHIGAVTPFEKNLKFWQQLWRVVEMSQVVVQILDARNPLLFYSPDLTKYCQEISERQNSAKSSILLLNKADLLSPMQRKAWKSYFENVAGVDQVLFFSAKLECLDPEDPDDAIILESAENELLLDAVELVEVVKSKIAEQLLTGNLPEKSKMPTVGWVGYPNVGKSSTINAILGKKAVSVSATPGKTKHYQTHILASDNLILCDCPGLVLPNTASTKAELVINGILPIDQLRDYRSPCQVISRLVPRVVFEHRYGLKLAGQTENEMAKGLKETKFVPYRKLLVFLAKQKGYASKGRPDESRAARLILKEFVRGSLLFAKTPPNCKGEDAERFQRSTLQIQPEDESTVDNSTTEQNKFGMLGKFGMLDMDDMDEGADMDDLALKDLKEEQVKEEEAEVKQIKDTPKFDNTFFEKTDVKVVIRGRAGLHQQINTQTGPGELGHKRLNRTKNKNKKEKARRLRKVDNEDDY